MAFVLEETPDRCTELIYRQGGGLAPKPGNVKILHNDYMAPWHKAGIVHRFDPCLIRVVAPLLDDGVPQTIISFVPSSEDGTDQAAPPKPYDPPTPADPDRSAALNSSTDAQAFAAMFVCFGGISLWVAMAVNGKQRKRKLSKLASNVRVSSAWVAHLSGSHSNSNMLSHTSRVRRWKTMTTPHTPLNTPNQCPQQRLQQCMI